MTLCNTKVERPKSGTYQQHSDTLSIHFEAHYHHQLVSTDPGLMSINIKPLYTSNDNGHEEASKRQVFSRETLEQHEEDETAYLRHHANPN